MGWKGTLRSINAEIKRAERENARNQREYAKYLKQVQKEHEAEQAQQEVEAHEDYLESLVSFHKRTISTMDWNSFVIKECPVEPIKNTFREEEADYKLQNYKPNFFVKLFRLINWRINCLKKKLEEAKQKDEYDFQQQVDIYQKELTIFNANFQMASKILKGDTMEYGKALIQYEACKNLKGKIIVNYINPTVAEVNLIIPNLEIIPRTAKTLLKSNKVSEKDFNFTKRNNLYQDFVCSSLFCCVRDIFAILPLEEIYISIETDLLDSSTGYINKKTILSAKIPKETIRNINFSQIDPSDAMKNFIHKMEFKSSTGFEETIKLKAS